MSDEATTTSESPEQTVTEPGGRRRGVSRRAFIRTGTIGAAAAGVIGAVPGLSGLLGGASAEAPAVSGAATDLEGIAPEVTGPIMAHITNASAGEVSLYVGERAVVFRDPALVQHLMRVAR